MILRVIIDNLYSFSKPVEFNMFTNKSQRHLSHKRSLGKVSYLKMAALYGANGAGKSNLVKSIHLLKAVVINGSLPSYVGELKYKLDKTCKDRPSSVAVEFVAKGLIYYYTITFDETGVWYELLSETLPNGDDRRIFEREYQEGKECVCFHDGFADEPKNRLFVEVLEEKFLDRKDVLLTMLQEKYGKDFPDTAVAYGWFSDTLNVVNASETTGPLAHVFVTDNDVLRLGNDIVKRLSVGVNGIYVSRYEIEQTDKTQRLFERLEKNPDSIMDVFNPYTGERTSFVKEGEKVMAETIRTNHTDMENNDVPFNFGMESDGTQRLVDYVPMLNGVMRGGKVFVIDEIERSIHPAVVKELVRLLSNDSGMDGQIVFTTHETCLLDQDILRTDEIWFAQKDKSGSTDLYSLSDYNVHATANVENGYLNGRYGAIPFLDDLKTLHWNG